MWQQNGALNYIFMQYGQYIRWFIILASTVIFLICILYQQDKPLNKLPTIKKRLLSTNLKASSTSEIKLIDITLDWHLNFSHQQRTKKISAITDTLGAGVCAFDYNNDGWTDLYIVGGSGNTRRYGRASWWHNTSGGRLFENRQGQYLKDVTNDAGINFIISGMGCAVDDINADGLTDIFITGIDANRLFKNNGDGSFSDVTSESGINSSGWSTSAVFGDFNNDGLPDLYVAKFIKFQKDATTFEVNSGFQAFDSAAFEASLYDAESNQLFLNKGRFIFEDVTEKFNVANMDGRSLGAQWIDINNDTWLDLIVINQHPSPNEVYINRSGQEFVLAKDTFNALRGSGNQDFIDADFNNDGHTNFFLTSGSQEPIQLLELQSLERSDDQSRFKDVSHPFGLANTKLTPLNHWGAISGDFNNDGYQDVFIANGKLTPDPDSHFVPLGQPNTLLINQSGKQFSIAKSNDIASINNSSRAAITTDLNNDGRLEIIVTNNNGNIQILEPEQTKDDNKKANNWIGFEWNNGNSINWKAGKVQIKYGKIQQSKSLSQPSGFLSQSEKRIHFGLGNNKQIDSVTIKIPEKSFTIKNLVAGHYYSIDMLTGKTEKLIYIKKEDTLESLAKIIDTDALNYLAKIILKNNNPKQIRILSVIWNRADSEQRLAILRSFTQINNLLELKLTLVAISDPNPEAAIIAINILKSSEIEQTMGALIGQLYSSNADIQCAAANTLSFFFREEEAMIFQKNLALKHLIRVLEKGKEQEQICVAQALGISESKRAVAPLLKFITTNPKTGILLKVAAIDALSEIRDSKAISDLTALVEFPESRPDEIGAALIALARMQSDSLKNLLQKVIYSRLKSSDKPSQIEAIHILKSIYKHSNVLFISRQLRQEHINPSIKKVIYELAPDMTALLNKKELSLALSFINIAAATRNTSLIGFLQSASKAEHQQIREQAIMALLKVTSTVNDQKQIAYNTLAKQSIEILIALLNLKETSASDRALLISTLENKIRTANLTSTQIKEIFFLLDSKTVSTLISKLLSNDLLDQQQRILLNICSEIQSSIKVSDLKNLSSKVKFEEDLLDCVYNPNASHASLPITVTYQIRKILNKLLNNNDIDVHHRDKILANAMLHDSVVAQYFLKKHSKYFSEQNMVTALHAIRHHNLLKQNETLIWNTIKNTANSDLLRMQAAWLANAMSPKLVDDFLQKDYNSQ